MVDLKCQTCKKPLANSPGGAKFLCPSCGKYEIVRCKQCRTVAGKYICPECNFEGPN